MKPVFYRLTDSGTEKVPYKYIKETQKSHKYILDGGWRERYASKEGIKDGQLIHFKKHGMVFMCHEDFPIKEVMKRMIEYKVRSFEISIETLTAGLATATKSLIKWESRLNQIT